MSKEAKGLDSDGGWEARGAANEIWTAEARLRDLREGSVVGHTKLMQGDSHGHTHTRAHGRLRRTNTNA